MAGPQRPSSVDVRRAEMGSFRWWRDRPDDVPNSGDRARITPLGFDGYITTPCFWSEGRRGFPGHWLGDRGHESAP
jgi:hypothetical protein